MENHEKEIRTLESEIKNLQIKKANTEIEVHTLEKRKASLVDDIDTFGEKKLLAFEEYKKENAHLQEIKKEAKGIKDDCRAEVAKVKKEWDDLAEETKQTTQGKKELEHQKVLLERDRQYVKEDGKKVTARRAGLDQVEAFLKTEKEKHSDSEKNLNAFASLLEKKDVQCLKDIANVKKEGERLIFIGKSLEMKRLEFDKMHNTLLQRFSVFEQKNGEMKVDIQAIEVQKIILDEKIKDAEASKKQYSEAYAGLSQKEKEVEIARLRLIKIGKEKLTEETLKKLEEEAKKDEI